MQLNNWLLIVLALLFIDQTQISLTKSGFNHFCNGITLLGRLLLHCTENMIYVFLEMKLRGLVPNSYIHVSVSDLYIHRIGLHIVAAAK
jgi:hypothetical protein